MKLLSCWFLSIIFTLSLLSTSASASSIPSPSKFVKSRQIPLSTRKANTAFVNSHSSINTLRAGSVSSLQPATMPTSSSVAKPAAAATSNSMKLIFGAAGIYASFLYYGSLQEDVFSFVGADDVKFKQAWFLQLLEAAANVIVGFLGMMASGRTVGIPQKMFAISGVTQVSAKAFTSLALANGLSFPVATLAKSGKMLPVMMGSLLLGGANYSIRDYLQVAAIIGGTAIVSMGNKKGGGASSSLGLTFIALSLACDGITGGVQKKLKAEMGKKGLKPKPYDFMFWTNLYMAIAALSVSGALGEVGTGIAYVVNNPDILPMIIKFALCSAIGQSFIFYTISNFDPLVCTTVTTTRKIFSVVLSIILKGHQLSTVGWSGLALASAGIIAEMAGKMAGPPAKDKKAQA